MSVTILITREPLEHFRLGNPTQLVGEGGREAGAGDGLAPASVRPKGPVCGDELVGCQAVSCGRDGSAGALVEFCGVVRAEEGGKAIAALEYEAYEPMARRVMASILEQLMRRHECLHAEVIHRIGVVRAGEAAIVVRVAAKHREPAFRLLTEFMDLLKQDVPVWKRRALSREELAGVPRRHSQEGGDGAASGRDGAAAAGVEEVLRLVREHASPVSSERAPLAVCLHRTLVEDVLAGEDQPAFDRSAVDGFAIRLDDDSSVFTVVDSIRAGEWKPRSLERGQAVRIATGGALPGAELRVVMKEDVRVEGDRLRMIRPAASRHIRFRGEDARRGQVLVRCGTRLDHGHLALLASLGHTSPLVARPLRGAHLVTGSELVPPEQTPPPGYVRDSNSSLVQAFLAGRSVALRQRRVPEDQAAALAAARELLETEPDLFLVSGGASVGEHDFTRALLAELGFEIHLSRTGLRPGKPLIVASRRGAVAFGLPGNPLAHFVCLNVFVRAAIERLCGLAPANPFALGVLGEALPADGQARETLWPARMTLEEGHVMLWPLRWASSGDLTSLAEANALLRVPAGARLVEKGAVMSFTRAGGWA